MSNSLLEHILKMLKIAKQAIEKNPHLTKETGKINAKGDKSIELDVEIERLLINYIKDNLSANIFSEEIGIIKLHNNPKYFVVFDPLDGSTNYKLGKGLLPFGTMIAIYKGVSPKLEDVICAGAIEHTRNLGWTYDGIRTTDLKGNVVKLKDNWEILPSTPVYLDLYYKKGYEAYRPLAQKIFVRNTGSTIGNLSCILFNVAAGLGGVCMRAEEIGTVTALIKGAGGKVIDHESKDLSKEKFSPEKTYPIIAGSKKVVDFIVKSIK